MVFPQIESLKNLIGHVVGWGQSHPPHTMRPQTREAMEQLFLAKWNVPKAADHCGLTWKEMKITFSEYCRLNPPTYDETGDLEHPTTR